MNITISTPDAQWLAVACARGQAAFPGGSKEAVIFERSLHSIIAALDRKTKQAARHSKKGQPRAAAN